MDKLADKLEIVDGGGDKKKKKRRKKGGKPSPSTRPSKYNEKLTERVESRY